ncbi:hypothetical protein SDC9_134635 [bioreactor metagenome]|uniref:Uncharacterized protein n=1 Tax=bioreactor metagenome TaxID=1076179 RepID=A0A645DDU5_9ZZZZ
MDKFNNNSSKNTTVNKVEKLLYGVPIIRGDVKNAVRDLRIKTLRWKTMNLFKILREIKKTLKEEIRLSKCKHELKTIEHIENFIESYLSREYKKRKLFWDVNIELEDEVKIRINGEYIDLGSNKEKIFKYFKDIL